MPARAWSESISLDLPVPVIDVRGTLHHDAELAVVGKHLVRIGILDDLRVALGAEREIAQLCIRGVHQLMRRLRAACRAGDQIAGSHRALVGSVTKRSVPLQDEEHFLVRPVAVERAAALARRDDRQRTTEVACADQRTEPGVARGEAIALLIELELDL